MGTGSKIAGAGVTPMLPRWRGEGHHNAAEAQGQVGYNCQLLPQPNCWHPAARRTLSLQCRQDHSGLAPEKLPVVMFPSQGELQLTLKSTNTAKD